MTLPCLTLARRFDVRLHRPFWMADQAVGWIRASDVPLLARWPDVFALDHARVTLQPGFDTVERRSAALGSVIGALAAEGRIVGWRDETYAIRNTFEAPPIAYIERAASRFFGTMTYAVHLNGIVECAACAPQMWIARRSESKATDPGMLDNVVAGGIGWGLDARATLIKECWEEAGIAAELAALAQPGRTLHVLQALPEGTQAEQIFVYDLALPEDFTPRNQDGEVAEHRLARLEELLRWIGEGTMTVDASLATLDCLLRHRWIEPQPGLEIAPLFKPPVLPAE
ncbi:NUDIX hydrolase [Paraburkholderia hayleyella]|uniref:NUDIX hydrolase n=1 Tax=Paraburkholderia hayleyella TaxID=2152889 RepID=UPI0012922FFC|nr:NUDIX hydrolase family protein [Paraburkholderia hayleyella]